jgi:fructooligosaccharide transport system substrate-binding protein
MKNKISFLILAILSVIMAACGSKEGENKIVVWTQASADHPEGKMFASRIEKYNAEHPDKLPVEIVNITRAGAGSGYIDKLNAALAANTLPDIFTLDGPDVTAYVESGVVGELDSYMSPGFKEGFTDAMISQGTVDGKLYAMGYQDSGVIVLYNEDMIKALPQDIQEMIPGSDEDWTWSQMVEVLKKIDKFAKTTDNPAYKEYATSLSLLLSDISSGAYELGTYYFTPLVWGNGGKIVGDDGITVDGYLNSPETVDAMVQYSRLFDKKAPLAMAAEPASTFHTGKSAFAVAGFWYINDLVNNYPSLKFRALRYPKMNKNFMGNYTPSGSWAFVRKADIDDKKVKQVVEVMEWLNNDEAAKEYYYANGAIPGRKNSVDVIDTNTDNRFYNEAWKVLKYQVLNTNNSRPTSPGYPYLSETFAKDIILKIAQNQATSKEEIKSYADSAVEKIKFEFKKYQ